jgi:hypothetical protein
MLNQGEELVPCGWPRAGYTFMVTIVEFVATCRGEIGVHGFACRREAPQPEAEHAISTQTTPLPAAILSAVVPHLGGAGLPPGVQVERPTGRTTWTPGGKAARLCLGRRQAGWQPLDQPHQSSTRRLDQGHPGAGAPPPEASFPGLTAQPVRFSTDALGPIQRVRSRPAAPARGEDRSAGASGASGAPAGASATAGALKTWRKYEPANLRLRLMLNTCRDGSMNGSLYTKSEVECV